MVAVHRPWGRKNHQGFFSCHSYYADYAHYFQMVMAGEAELMKHEPQKTSLYYCSKETQVLFILLCKVELKNVEPLTYCIRQDFEK